MGKLLYVWVRGLYFGIGCFTQRRKGYAKARLCVTFAPLRETLLHRGKLLGHADEVGEGVGAHFLHDLAAMEFDCDLARA